jgi:hypothetical protein
MPKEFSSEALKVGLKPPENATKGEIDTFRNSVDPDEMGFDGQEAGDLSEFEDPDD